MIIVEQKQFFSFFHQTHGSTPNFVILHNIIYICLCLNILFKQAHFLNGWNNPPFSNDLWQTVFHFKLGKHLQENIFCLRTSSVLDSWNLNKFSGFLSTAIVLSYYQNCFNISTQDFLRSGMYLSRFYAK